MKQNLTTLVCLLILVVTLLDRNVAAHATAQPLFHSTNVKCDDTRQVYFYGTVYDGLAPLSNIPVAVETNPSHVAFNVYETDADGKYFVPITLAEGASGISGTFYVWVVVTSIQANSDYVPFHIEFAVDPVPNYPYCAAGRADFNSKYLMFFPLASR